MSTFIGPSHTSHLGKGSKANFQNSKRGVGGVDMPWHARAIAKRGGLCIASFPSRSGAVIGGGLLHPTREECSGLTKAQRRHSDPPPAARALRHVHQAVTAAPHPRATLRPDRIEE